MKNSEQESQALEQLRGSVERVTFHNEENGFCVLRTKIKGQRDLVTVIGSVASIAAGEFIECHGVWFNDKKHGLQFKAQQLTTIAPTTLDGIEKYLGSGMLKGIGVHFAKQLVQAFGEGVFDVIEKHPERLTELEGIGEKRKQQLVSAWEDQKAVRDIMVFLQSYGVGTARAVRIYKTYGAQAIDKVRANPYRLALDIHGIGFKIADQLAVRLGVAQDSLIRAQAGVHHVLQTHCDRGHCAAEYAQLMDDSASLLEISISIIEAAIKQEIISENLIAETINDIPCIFLLTLYQAETRVASYLRELNTANTPWGMIDTEKAISWVEQKTGLILSESQQRAVKVVLQCKVVVITGGPGVGKTTIVNSIIKIIRAKRVSVALCAPTGRAAKRLTETTGMTAKTIHRLLEYDPQNLSFKHHQENPLAIDVLVIDEASMLDIVLFYHLLKAVPAHAAVIFVGDVDQLPSVGPGSVLSDIIKSGVISVVQLTEIFRQASSSNIIANAHRINRGEMPLTSDTNDSDFYTIYSQSVEELHDKLIEMVTERIPAHFNCNPITDIQVLTPMNRGGLGTRALNIALQAKLNGHQAQRIDRFGWTFSVSDKVIQHVNNYDKDVFNGDIGRITHINFAESSMTILFDQRQLEYSFNELDEISLAYAISIHKSQGSEFPIVVLPLSTQHYMLLARNLLYTGVTRGKNLVVLIGQQRAVELAVNNSQGTERLTNLRQRLAARSGA